MNLKEVLVIKKTPENPPKNKEFYFFYLYCLKRFKKYKHFY